MTKQPNTAKRTNQAFKQQEGAMHTQMPLPLGASKAVVYKFAEDVAKHVNYAPRENMSALVSRLGGQISYHKEVNPVNDFPESIIVYPSGEFQIYLPLVTTSERDRFTIAHELGHFFLHFPKIKNEYPDHCMVATRRVDSRDVAQQRAEWEANWFSAAFLMPEHDFRSSYEINGLEFTASHFGVSIRAAEVRARTLGLIRD